jgi:hypothetical protein
VSKEEQEQAYWAQVQASWQTSEDRYLQNLQGDIQAGILETLHGFDTTDEESYLQDLKDRVRERLSASLGQNYYGPAPRDLYITTTPRPVHQNCRCVGILSDWSPEDFPCDCGQPSMADSSLCADCRTVAEEKTPEPAPPPEPPRPAEVLGDWIRRPCGGKE